MSHSELLWKYIEGSCSPEEQARAERLLAEDPQFRKEWALRSRLHQGLKEQEPEQPSLRFARNVMDLLPRLYGKREAPPLISPLWQKVMGGLAGAFLLAYFALAFVTVELSNPDSMSRNPVIEGFVNTLTSLPMQAMNIIFALASGYILLTMADQKLKKLFSH